ncbi:transcription initiation factor TFIID subunit 11-like [Capsicum annuum]|uniref:transcription initiation factor TFIID subunit 11-like n=1 Tax=Capsicum annuum TaxID=4072 RepID=UPI001FB0ED66|nr:transcription initiation factor TFIID subunit 11-like [Capsicum annuum]
MDSAQSASVVEGETNSASQPSQLNEIDIWVQFAGGKKKGRVKGLGSLGQSVKTSKKSTSTLSKEIDEMIKSQVDALNVDLYSQLQNERHKNKRIRKELDLLMKHVYKKSSSNDERPSQKDNQAYEDKSDDDSNDVNESDSNSDNVNESDSDPDG